MWTSNEDKPRINIELAGWTNPSSAGDAVFTLATMDPNGFAIDEVEITYAFEPLDLDIKTFETSGDTAVLAYPDYYSVEFTTTSAVLTTYSI